MAKESIRKNLKYEKLWEQRKKVRVMFSPVSQKKSEDKISNGRSKVVVVRNVPLSGTKFDDK